MIFLAGLKENSMIENNVACRECYCGPTCAAIRSLLDCFRSEAHDHLLYVLLVEEVISGSSKR